LLLDHGYKTTDIAGIAFLEDDEKGLYLKAEMPLDIPEVANAYKKTKFMIERGGKMGLSIGYDTVKALPGEDGTRRLKELALHEVSITPFPMNTEAQIMAAKARKSAVQPKPKNVTRRKAVTHLQNEEFSSFVDEIKQLITSLKES
jgi:HK97 family phage prohead protease